MVTVVFIIMGSSPRLHFQILSHWTFIIFLRVNKVRYYYPHLAKELCQRLRPNDLLQNSISELALQYSFCDSESIGEASIPRC